MKAHRPIFNRKSQTELCKSRSRGVGLIELLVSLSICAALLTATGVAIDASFQGYSINQQQSSTMQRSRLSIHRMLAHVRTTREHTPITASLATQFAAGTIVTDTGIAMLDNDGNEIQFSHDVANGTLLLRADGTNTVMLRGVDVFQVKFEPMRSPGSIKIGGGYDLLKRASILLTAHSTSDMADTDESGSNQVVTLSSSVMPRRNSW